MRATEAGGNVELRAAADGAFFSLPRGDVAMLPLVNTTVEELSRYLGERLVARLGRERLRARRVDAVTLSVCETPGQEAAFSVAVGPAEAEAGGGGGGGGGGSGAAPRQRAGAGEGKDKVE